jgi:hypothetical protein
MMNAVDGGFNATTIGNSCSLPEMLLKPHAN